MPLPGSRLRALALLVGGAAALHQARYQLVDAAHTSGPPLAEHAYLHAVTPFVLGLLALSAVEFLLRLARPGLSPEPRTIPRAVELWVAATAALLAIYGVQETLEGVLGHGQAGLTRILGAGGWVVILLAAAIGGLIALLLRGSAAALELVATRRRAPRHGEQLSALAPPLGQGRSLNAIARFMAGRGPPPASV